MLYHERRGGYPSARVCRKKEPPVKVVWECETVRAEVSNLHPCVAEQLCCTPTLLTFLSSLTKEIGLAVESVKKGDAVAVMTNSLL